MVSQQNIARVATATGQSTSGPTSPLHQFRVFVAERLQKVPFGWGGAAGYQLAEKHADLIQQQWRDGVLVDEAAHAVHRAQMGRSQKITPISRASLIAAGCVFTNLYTPSEAERERSERQGDAIDTFRREI